ncbi:MAG: hypothetical protein DWB56_12675 [Candidatus Jettenia sp.]|uniref:M50 family metallopeptidase n=1 Tax=Candidatus Jettenia sp. AMX1 TaxID=2293637 RepID=UPI0002E5054C|nr:M50 family metallopeptidase [Candidatus Jettenia sp. AMX1]MBC6929790.1 hypothetical protein [Candidatus Jettenia sp.]WKZ15044.1 MAG: M50 family metallopeptidase [Candidatus Jettenia caeni]KAA0248774.1 MAG: hypothetical protein EDM77_11390 [Candidatus Jettenia sp. AMX1]MCE7881395.1 hypothetical protein [Candidatus Jettenia sp. AMX1]MCQ3927976.1 hypothetical protein [Candidatus Jettenia sp.]
MIYFLLAISLVLVLLLSFAISGLWAKYANTKMIAVFLFPGIVVHELSHALLCLATGTTIKELNLFSSNGGGIKYDKPKISGVFDFIITSAPVFGCAFFIFFIPKILSHPIHFSTTFPSESPATLSGFFALIQHLYDAVLANLNTFRNQFQIKNIHHSIFLFAIIIFAVSIAPQKQDIKYLITGFGILSGIFFCLEKFGIHLAQNAWWNFCLKELWVITALTISVLIPLLLITLIVMGFGKGYALTFGRKGSGKGAGKGTNKNTRSAGKHDTR